MFSRMRASSNSTSGCLPCRPEISLLKRHCTPVFTAALLTVAKTGNPPTCPSKDEQTKTLYSIFSCTMRNMYMIKYYSALKKNEILSYVTTWMKVENIMLSEIKPGTGRQIPHVLILCRI